MAPRITSPSIRFSRKTKRTERFTPGLALPCLEWVGARDKDGYGLFQVESTRTVRAHRHAYAEAHGDPGKLLVRHRCDNPPCVEPTHLVGGTNTQNMADMKDRKRDGARRAEGHYGAKMTQEKVDELKRRKGAGESAYSMFREFGISYSQAKAIVSGRKWKPLSPRT